MLLPLIIVLATSSVSVDVLLAMESTRTVEHSWSTTKEHSENVIWVKLVLSELLAISLLETLFSPMLIIDLSLFWVVQACECCTDLLESISCIWCPVFVWMKLKC